MLRHDLQGLAACRRRQEPNCAPPPLCSIGKEVGAQKVPCYAEVDDFLATTFMRVYLEADGTDREPWLALQCCRCHCRCCQVPTG